MLSVPKAMLIWRSVTPNDTSMAPRGPWSSCSTGPLSASNERKKNGYAIRSLYGIPWLLQALPRSRALPTGHLLTTSRARASITALFNTMIPAVRLLVRRSPIRATCNRCIVLQAAKDPNRIITAVNIIQSITVTRQSLHPGA